MITFAALFGCGAWLMFLLWMQERRERRFWQERSGFWERMHGQAVQGWENCRVLNRALLAPGNAARSAAPPSKEWKS